MAITLMDEGLNIIDCNQNAVEMFGMASKHEYITTVYNYFFPRQPSGLESKWLIDSKVTQAFEEGYANLPEFLCRKKDGTELTVETIYVRVHNKESFAVIEYMRDVSDKKLAEEREQDAILFQHMLYDSNPIPSSLWMPDMESESAIIIDCTQSAVDIVGAKNKRDYIDNFFNYQPKYLPCGTILADKVKILFLQTMEEQMVRCSWVLQHASGELIPGDLTLVRVGMGENMVAAYFQDIRPLLTADEKIRQALEMTQLLLDTSPALVEIWDSNHEFQDCNKKTLEAFGVSTKEEFISRYTETMPLFQPCGLTSTEFGVQQTVTVLSEGFNRYEIIRKRFDGEFLPLETSAFRVNHGDKKLIITYSNDLRVIKASLRNESEREMNERMHMMFDATPLNIEYWDKEYNVIDCNRTTLDYYGFADKEAFRKSLFRNSPAFQPDGTPSRYLWNTHLEEIFATGEGKFSFVTYRSGEPAYMEVQGIRIMHNDEIVVVTYASDITQQKQAQEERRRTEIAEESSRAKSLFLARMSHEIRTPISAVLGISEINLQNPNLPPTIEEAFAKIFNSADMLLNLVNDILDLSKIEAGKMTIIHEQYEVASMINDAANLSLLHVGSKNIKFEMNISEDLPTILIGDFLRIEQVLNNLLSNAFKYTESGTVKLSLQCIPLEENAITLQIAISDTGFGMTNEQLDTIYNDYSRFHESEKRFIGGAGLGIPIVYSLVDIMGGKIDIESEVGKGTSITINLPQKIAGAEILGRETAYRLQQLESSANAAAKRFKFTPDPMPYGSVLVVDDVEANLFVAKGLLNFYSLKIETCDSGYEAIRQVKSGKTYDIIFMDHMMPGMNGVEAMRELRDMGYTNPIVALTANAMLGQAEEFMKSGFDGFISKPIQTKQLNNLLTKHIKDKQSPEVLAAAKQTSTQEDIENFMQNTDVATKLRKDFVRTNKNAFNELEQTLAKNDLHTARRIVHNIKGTSALIRESTLTKLAQTAEDLLAEEKFPSQENLSALNKELSRILSEIGEPQKPTATKTLDQNGKKEAATLFDTLAPLLAERNSVALDYLPQLRTIPESAVTAQLIEDFEFPLAAKTLEVLRTVLEI